MNKTISIGLAGFSFIIEEHAYIKLSDYLKSLRNALEKDEADEVMHDIEIRIVEIFRECLQHSQSRSNKYSGCRKNNRPTRDSRNHRRAGECLFFR